MRTPEERLCHAIQALAQPADVQRSLFPAFVVVGDELAEELGDALVDFENGGAALSPSQAGAIRELDGYLDALSGPANLDFWDDPADARWERARRLAASALAAFGWPNLCPPRDGAVYVSGQEVIRND